MKNLLPLLYLLGLAAATDAGSELKAIRARYENVKSLKGKFEQTICSEQLGYCQSFEGTFYIARPDQFRFEVVDPARQISIGDSEAFWIYLPDSGLARKSPPLANPFFDILLGASTDAFVAESLSTGDDGRPILTLAPSDSLAMFQGITLVIEPKTHSIAGIDMDDGMGTHTRYELSEQVYNPKLAPGLFHFTPPPGTTVIE